MTDTISIPLQPSARFNRRRNFSLRTAQIRHYAVHWLIALMFLVPAAVFFVVINLQVPLVPLVGIEAVCAKCNRPATRTLPTAAEALRTRGIYVYDKQKYPVNPPVWCDHHGPESASDNAPLAYGAALGAFVLVAGTARLLGH